MAGQIPNNLLTYDQATKKYGCSKKTLERAIKRGDIEAYRPGAHVLIDERSANIWFLSTKIRPVRVPGPKRRRVKVNLPPEAQG